MSEMKHLYTLAQEIREIDIEIDLYTEGLQVGSFWNRPEAEKYLAKKIARRGNIVEELNKYPVTLRVEAILAVSEVNA
jgi:hypothetical protein